LKLLQKLQVIDAVPFIALGTVRFYVYLVYGMYGSDTEAPCNLFH